MFQSKLLFTTCSLIGSVLLSFASSANAATTLRLCVQKNGAVIAKTRCARGEHPFNTALITSVAQTSVGPQGADGPQGAQGLQGVQGAQGPVGPQGVAGPKGDQGTPGIQGPAGVTGFETVTGPDNKVVVPATTFPGFPGFGTLATVTVKCPTGKIVFAHACPDQKYTLPGFPTELSLLTSSTVNGDTLSCTYSNSGPEVTIPFAPVAVCGPIP